MQDVKALYRCEVKNISRQSKHSKCTGSAVAASAYRAGENLHDERADKRHSYRNRSGDILHTELIHPKNAPEWAQRRETLWNRVETAERYKNARMAKEIVLTLPYGLDKPKILESVRSFVQKHVVDAFDIPADIAIHRYGRTYAEDSKEVANWKSKNLPFLASHKTEGVIYEHVKIIATKDGEVKGYKHYAPHAHVMIPLRQFDNDTETGFVKKKDRELDKRQQVIKWREAWQDNMNAFFEKHGIDIIFDCKKKVPSNDNKPETNDNLPELSELEQAELEQAELELKTEITKNPPDIKRILQLKDTINRLRPWEDPTEEELDQMFIQWGKKRDQILKAKTYSEPVTKPKQVASILKNSNRTQQRE